MRKLTEKQFKGWQYNVESSSDLATLSYARMPPHQPGAFSSETKQLTIGVSFSGHHGAVWQRGGSRAVECDIPRGSTFVTVAEPLQWLRVSELSEALEWTFEPEALRQTVESLGGWRVPELPEVVAVDDKVVWAAASQLRRSLVTPQALGPLMQEQELQSLVVHLLSHHAGWQVPQGPRRLDAMCLKTVLEWIDKRQAPTLKELADTVGMSVFHFARAFRATTGTTPHAYVSARLMDRALGEILRTKKPIVDIAHASGYVSAAHFRTAFKRCYGINPGSIRAV